MASLLNDVRYALRQLRRSPGFTLFAVMLVGLGVGATTAMFSVIHAVLLEPLRYRDPDQIVQLSKSVTPVRFDEMKIASRSYAALGAFAGGIEQMALSGVETPEVLNGARVSANFLQILGASPLLGRSFLPEEDRLGGPAVAMIDEKLWQHRFGRDPNMVGKTIVLAGTPHTVVGVLPTSFQFPFPGLDFWVPRPEELSTISARSRPLSPTLRVFGRLSLQATIERANAELATLKRQYAAAHPGMLDGKLNVPETLVPLKDQLVSDIRPKLWMLFGALGLVLLIICANIGGLLLARATARRREFAVRASIGAGRGRIILQLLVESILLALVGGLLGLVLAGAGMSAIRTMTFIDLPRAGEIHVDYEVVGFALTLSTAGAVLFGLAPLTVASRRDLASTLRGSSQLAGSKPTTASRLLFGPRDLLVTGQVAVSVTLLIGTALLIESLVRLYRVDPGFDPVNLLTMHISLSPARYDTDEKRAAFYERLSDQVRSLPGVRNAALSLTLPFKAWAGVPIQLASAAPIKLSERPISIVEIITPEYFRTMGIAIKRGRAFTTLDNLHSPRAVIISESVARQYWPQYPEGPNPVGQQLLVGSSPNPVEIVGISANVREEYRGLAPKLGIYLAMSQAPNQSAVMVVRSSGNPLALADAVRKEILAIDPQQPASNIATMNEVRETSEGQLRLVTRLLGSFAGGATVVAMIGLYAVISYLVALRTKEFGIRQALGAERRKIFWLVLRRGVAVSVVGIVLGQCAGFVLTRFLKDLLFQVSPTDATTFAGISALIIPVVMLASFAPARRAATIDLMTALRYE